MGKEEKIMDLISVIVPCYNEEESIPLFCEEMHKVIKKVKVNWEIIFINDGSTDNTLEVLKKLASKYKRVKYFSFTRNFGKEAAIMAGIEKAKGNYIGLMDVDLQDPPQFLEDMYYILKHEDYDCVRTRRATRKGEALFRSIFSKAFYKLINKICSVKIVDGARDYCLMKKCVASSIMDFKEVNRFFKGIVSYTGYKTKWLEFENVERVAGETKWSLWQLFKYAMEAIFSFSVFPLILATIMGIICFILSLLFIVIIFIKTIIFSDPVSGWPSLACIILFCSGVQLFSLGIIGEYLAKTYYETKKRPLYIVRESSEEK